MLLVDPPPPQRQVFSALSQISKHSVDLAEMVVEAEVFPAILTSLKGTLPLHDCHPCNEVHVHVCHV